MDLLVNQLPSRRRTIGWCCALLTLLGGVTAWGEEAAAPRGFSVNVRDHGAKGDGRTDDTTAFQQAAAALQKAGGGTLVIPTGIYLVGRQHHVDGQYPYYQHEPIVELHDLAGVHIRGMRGTILRTPAGLRYGSFDKDTGAALSPPPSFVDRQSCAQVGSMIALANCRDVVIEDLELDGNAEHLILGGSWGDTGRQLLAYGIWLYNNRDVVVRRVHTHHHGLDGIAIGWSGLKDTDPSTPHELEAVVSEYNGRQGLSWVGGRGLTARNCKFNHTGRGSFASAPSAGLDIEAEDSVCRDGLFIDCEFINNRGCAMAADSGDGGYSRFVNCTFWGTTAWSVWAAKPGLAFEHCQIFGSIVHGRGHDNPELATRYTDCTFEDREWPGGGVYRSAAVVMQQGKNVTFERCTIIANQTRALYIDTSADRELLRDCVIIHRWAQAPDRDFQSLLRGSRLENVTFIEDFPAENKHQYFIAGENVSIGPNVVVAGPQVKMWNWSWGQTGTIADPTSK